MNVNIIAILFILITIAIYSTDARRGGGGARIRSGVRTGSSSTRIRRYSGPSYSRGSWQRAAALGTLYGASHYQRRRLYRDHPDREPAICFNEVDLRNETFGYFICPEEDQDDSLTSCCGEENAQHCCVGKISGAVIGAIVGGIVLMLGILMVIICVCVVKNRRMTAKRAAVPAQSWSSQQPSTDEYTIPNATAPTDPPGYSNEYSTPYSGLYSGFPGKTDGQNAQNTTPIGFEGTASVPSSDPPPYSENGKY